MIVELFYSAQSIWLLSEAETLQLLHCTYSNIFHVHFDAAAPTDKSLHNCPYGQRNVSFQPHCSSEMGDSFVTWPAFHGARIPKENKYPIFPA